MTSIAFRRMAVETAATKRAPAPSSGLVGAAAVYLTGLRCTPLDPVNAEIAQRLGLDTPHEVLQTFAEGQHDIREGDILVCNDKSYPIRAVEDWRWDARTVTQRLVLEQLKR